MQKPDGFTVIRPCDLPQLLYQLKLRDVPGIGTRLEAKLNQKGIFTMEMLLSMSPREMRQAWGSVCGEEMWHLLKGEEVSGKLTAQKSISHSHVLPPELRNNAGGIRILKKLTTNAARRLRKEGLFASGLQIYASLSSQRAWKANCGFIETQDTVDFLNSVITLWKGLPEGPVLAVGMALTGLVSEAAHTPYLFENLNKAQLSKTLDRVNTKYGEQALHYGATHESADLVPLRIAFTRIPDADEK